MTTELALTILPGIYAVSRLPSEAIVPDWALGGQFSSITRTDEELSILCPQRHVPEGIQHEPDWRCLKVEGPLSFSLTGILASLLGPLAEAEVGVFAISTYNTDYILVKAESLKEAINALLAAGHDVRAS
jgi:hypothetical protein